MFMHCISHVCVCVCVCVCGVLVTGLPAFFIAVLSITKPANRLRLRGMTQLVAWLMMVTVN